MPHYLAKVYSTHYKAETRILPTSYADRDDAHRAARRLDLDHTNRGTRIDNTLYLVASHHVIDAPTQAEALAKAATIARQPFPQTTIDE